MPMRNVWDTGLGLCAVPFSRTSSINHLCPLDGDTPPTDSKPGVRYWNPLCNTQDFALLWVSNQPQWPGTEAVDNLRGPVKGYLITNVARLWGT